MILSPTEPSPVISPSGPNTSFAASSYLEVQSHTMSGELGSSGAIDQAYDAETTVQGVFDPAGQSPAPQPVENTAAEQAASEEAEETNPLLEASPPASALDITEPPTTPPAPEQDAVPSLSEPAPAPQPASTTEPSEPAPSPPQQPSPLTQDETAQGAAPAISLQPPDSPALLPIVTAEDEDDGLNLLGSLERELDRQEGMSNESSGSDGKTTPMPAAAAAAEVAVEVPSSSAAAADVQAQEQVKKVVADSS
jgi:hypothetical protein